MRNILSNADCVIFDFDGPLCSLFAVHSAALVADRLRARTGAPGDYPGDDPHAVLRACAARDSTRVGELERALTAEEISAAGTARPTPGAEELVCALAAHGRLLAVASNNSPLAVGRYLARRGLAGAFAGRVHGRTGDLARLKPHPDAVLRALASTGTPARRALLIGDAPADLAAATTAGVAFLGYAPTPRHAAALRAAGALEVATALEPVLRALTTPDGH